MEPMYYIGLDVHKRKISYCGRPHDEPSRLTVFTPKRSERRRPNANYRM